MWVEGTEGENAVNTLLLCLDDCAKNGVPIMVCHTIIGFDKHSPNEVGINNYRKIVDRAKELGVKIAFENTEGEEYLKAVMEAFSCYDNVGFCWDTGHEMCYNHSKDMMALYGDRLVGTHLNDNMGITGDHITWHDDAHLLPFDGIADWQGIRDRLRRHGWNGPLTFELTAANKPNRHTHDAYQGWDYEQFVTAALSHARRFAAL